MNRTGGVAGRGSTADAVCCHTSPDRFVSGLVRLELIAGLLVLAAVVVISLSIMTAGDQSVADNAEFYTIEARFDNIGDLGVDSRVAASGVTIGRVSSVDYDNETYEAVVGLSINRKYDRFPLDTAASILTAGFTGDQFVELQPGADDVMLKQGDIIDLTQSSLILEQVIGQFIYNQSQDDTFRDDPYQSDPFQAPDFGEQVSGDDAFVTEHQETGENDE
jgi:phospholipid/cholesterol/gamma-HCH transport system substrate-binding protein